MSHSGDHSKRVLIALVILASVRVVVCVLRMLVGNSFGWADDAIVRGLRAERLIMGSCIGVGLGVAGVLMQALLRNPLASPYILGASSGAALGVMVSMGLGVMGVSFITGAMVGVTQAIAAVAGASLTLIIVYVLSQKNGLVDPLGLLLTGVIVNAINGALMMLINYLVPNQIKADMAVYLMGYLDTDVGVTALFFIGTFKVTLVQVACVVTAISVVVAVMLGRSLDVATLSDAEAESMGLSVGMLRVGVFALAGVLTAMTVILAGPIGFVGLICPHVVRLMVGPRHRALLIGSAMTGVALVVGADTAVKAISWQWPSLQSLPIGVLTAAIGGPVFLLMLRPTLGRGSSGGYSGGGGSSGGGG